MTRPINQPDLFLAPIRDTVDLMDVPFLSLSNRRRVTPIRYRRGDVSVEVSAPAQFGIASVWDWDVALWAVSRIVEAANLGKPLNATVSAPVHDILRSIGRDVGGRDYHLLKEAADRLVATTVRTTVRSTTSRGSTFSLLERVDWQGDDKGRVIALSITLPSWLLTAIEQRRVLAVDDRYFALTGGLERWLYRLVRKGAGDNKTGWRWTMADLHERSGTTRPLRSFAADVRRLVLADPLPEYRLTRYRTTAGEGVQAVRRSFLARDDPGYEARLARSDTAPA